MKFLFRNTDNIFMLKENKCVYKNQHCVNVLNNSESEYELLKKIFLSQDVSDDEFRKNDKFFKKLLKDNYIVQIPNDIKSNHKLYKTFQYLLMTNKISDFKQLKEFQNRKVLIVGLGGTALEVIRQLVSLDFRNYILVDYDFVNETNLNRQFLFQSSDVGKYKIDVVENYIKQNVKSAEVVKYNMRISGPQDINKIIKDNELIDMVLCCADTPPIDIELYILTELLNKKIAYLGSGVGIFKGSIGPLLIDVKNKVKYINQLNKSKSILNVLTNCSASYGITNTIISALMANECIEYLLTGKSKTLNKTLIYYFTNNTTEFYDV